MQPSFRKLTENEVTFLVEHEPEDMPLEGNAMASGDDAVDQECYRYIRTELANGNDWAWCIVKVTATWQGFEGSDYLGGCSYTSEADFRQAGGYFDDMRAAALDALNERVANVATALLERSPS